VDESNLYYSPSVDFTNQVFLIWIEICKTTWKSAHEYQHFIKEHGWTQQHFMVRFLLNQIRLQIDMPSRTRICLLITSRRLCLRPRRGSSSPHTTHYCIIKVYQTTSRTAPPKGSSACNQWIVHTCGQIVDKYGRTLSNSNHIIKRSESHYHEQVT
jgi:hypothetical protein